MELQGRRLIAAPPAAVWVALNDAAVLQRCIPGCEEVLQLSQHQRSARVAVKLGPVRARFNGKVTLRDIRPDQGCTLSFEGSGGAAGFARGESVVTLEPDGEGTQVGYTVNASVGGKLGQVGGRMIDSAARGMADEFFEALAREWQAVDVDSAAAPTVDAATPTDAAAPTAPTASSRLAPPAIDGVGLEALRVKWFVLGAAATGFGFALAHWLA